MKNCDFPLLCKRSPEGTPETIPWLATFSQHLFNGHWMPPISTNTMGAGSSHQSQRHGGLKPKSSFCTASSGWGLLGGDLVIFRNFWNFAPVGTGMYRSTGCTVLSHIEPVPLIQGCKTPPFSVSDCLPLTCKGPASQLASQPMVCPRSVFQIPCFIKIHHVPHQNCNSIAVNPIFQLDNP